MAVSAASLRSLIGRRAAFFSAMIGMLCVLAELCFLLPDLFVTPEALPHYVANLGVFRAILQGSILSTFALGLVGIVLMPGSRRALFGLMFGGLAIVMGGWDAQPLDIDTPRGLAAGLDYFILELLILGLVFVPMEALAPLRPARILRAGWQTDLKHFFVSHAGVQLLSFATMIPAQMAFAWAVKLDFQQAVASQPVWLQFLQILLVVDLTTYWVHRAFHQVPWLWSFHAIHHSSRHLDWLAGSRMHIVDVLVTRSAAFLPVFVLGFDAQALYAYLVFVSFHAVFIHANVRWRFPYLRWVIATPQYHHWHHTSDEEGLDKNFAGFLPLWDLLFRTAHQPDHWPQRYGTVNFQPPETYLGQLAYPFRRKGKATPYG